MATLENSNDKTGKKRERKVALADLSMKYQATMLDGMIPDIPDHENRSPGAKKGSQHDISSSWLVPTVYKSSWL